MSLLAHVSGESGINTSLMSSGHRNSSALRMVGVQVEARYDARKATLSPSCRPEWTRDKKARFLCTLERWLRDVSAVATRKPVLGLVVGLGFGAGMFYYKRIAKALGEGPPGA